MVLFPSILILQAFWRPPEFAALNLAVPPEFAARSRFLGVFEAEFEQNPRGLAVENLNMNPQKVGDFSVALVTLSWTYR